MLVDAGQRSAAEALKAALDTLGGGNPTFIISTHEHEEHIGGNKIFGPEPVVIGHPNVRKRLTSGIYLFDEFPDATLPELTITDSMSLFFNGEEIKVTALTGAHTASDLVVWFTESKVACVGAISNGPDFPSVDSEGGDVMKYPDVVGRLLDWLPDDAMIIPGHGADGNMDDLRAFHKMLVETTEVIRAGLAEGKDLKTLQDEEVLKDWESWGSSYTSINRWIQYLVEGIQGKEDKDAPYEVMYYALKEKGIDGAIAQYNDMKVNQADEYDFGELAAVLIGYKLYNNDRVPEALRFFEVSVKDYPQGRYAYYCYQLMAETSNKAGNKEQAIAYLKKSIELNPDNTDAVELLEELENQ